MANDKKMTAKESKPNYDWSEFNEIESEITAYFKNDPTMWKETSNGNGMCRYKRNSFVNATETAGVNAKYCVQRRTFQGDETISKRWEFSDSEPSEGDELTEPAEILASL